MKECILGSISAVLFAVSFWIAGLTALAIITGVSDWGCFNCNYPWGEILIFGFGSTIVAIALASIAWLILRLGEIPRRHILPVWAITFASVVVFLSYAGDDAAALYITVNLWVPVSLLVVGYLYFVIRRNTYQGIHTPGADESADLRWSPKEAVLVSVVAPLSAATFWIAGGSALTLVEAFKVSQINGPDDWRVSAASDANVAVVVLMLIIYFVAWLILRLGKVQHGYVMPSWLATFAAVIAILTVAGEQTTDIYMSNRLWLLVTFGFGCYLALRYTRVRQLLRLAPRDNANQGGQPLGTAEPSESHSCSDGAILAIVVTPLSAITFWIAGWIASSILEELWYYQLEGATDHFTNAFFLLAALLAVVALIIFFIAWLVLRLANIPRDYVMPIWFATFASVVGLLTIAGGATKDFYVSNQLWIVVTFGFVGYLCWMLRSRDTVYIPPPTQPQVNIEASARPARGPYMQQHMQTPAPAPPTVVTARKPRVQQRTQTQSNIGFAMQHGPHRITDAFQAARDRGDTAIVPFVTAGFPERDSTEYVVTSLANAGADVIEIGVPFSDPLAEGPVIQRSSAVALNNDIKPPDVFDQVALLRAEGIKTPIVLMGYYNPLLAMGLEAACEHAAEAGVDGIIAADLPAAEAKPLLDACNKHGLALVPLVALTSTDAALELSCRQASGFVYCVSVLGVTGARATISNDVQRLVKSVKSMTDLPVAVGFGVSNAQHVREIGSYADGAVVGSALVRAIEAGEPDHAPQIAADFIASLRERPA